MVDGKWVRVLYGHGEMYCSNFNRFVDYMGWVLENGYPAMVYDFNKTEEDEVIWGDGVEEITAKNFYLFRNTLIGNNSYYVGDLDKEDRFIRWQTYLEF